MEYYYHHHNLQIPRLIIHLHILLNINHNIMLKDNYNDNKHLNNKHHILNQNILIYNYNNHQIKYHSHHRIPQYLMQLYYLRI